MVHRIGASSSNDSPASFGPVRDRATPARDSGFVLVVVLWIAALVALALLSMGWSVRSRLASTAAEIDHAKAHAAAEAGLQVALLELLAARAGGPAASQRLVVAQAPFECRFADARLRLRIEDEGGKVNLNLAEQALLRAVLEGLGAPADTAQVIAGEIERYRTPRSNDPNGGEDLPLGSGTISKGAPFDSIDELEQIRSLHGPLLARLRALATVHSDTRGIDPAVAPKALLTAIGRDDDATAPDPRLPTRFLSRSPGRSFTLASEARLGDSSAAALAMIVRLGSARNRTYTIVSWRITETSEAPNTMDMLENC